MTLEIQVLAWERQTNVAGLNRLMGFQPFRFENWISNDITRIKKLSKT